MGGERESEGGERERGGACVREREKEREGGRERLSVWYTSS